jgi:hypothetical protein
MFIENGYGKTIHLRIEDYLDMTDEDWQEIIASGHGEFIENPWVDYTGITKEKVVPIEDLDGTVEFLEVDIDMAIDDVSTEYD